MNQRRDYVLAKQYTTSSKTIRNKFSMYELRRAATDYICCGVMVVGISKDGKFKRYPPESVTSDSEWVGIDAIKPMLRKNDGTGSGFLEWERDEVEKPIWFTRIDSDEPCLFDTIREYIDAYELLWSRKQDALADMPNSPIVVSGYLDDPDEFVNRVREDGVIFIAKDGQCDEMKVRTDYTEINKQLETLKAAIYDIGCAVDMATAVIGNTSSVALRLLYVDLESKCWQLGDALLEAIRRSLEFDHAGMTDSEATDIDIRWSFNAIVNENDAIMNAVQSQNLISVRTMLSHHPWVIDVDKELEALSNEVVFGDESSTDDSQEIRIASKAIRASEQQSNNREDISKILWKYTRSETGPGGTGNSATP